MSDSELDKIDAKIAALKKGHLSNPDVMRQLQQLQVERNQRKDVLMHNEVSRYNNYLTNPFTSMNERPETLPENHAQRSLTQFLQTHHDVITPNHRGHLIIDGHKVSENPHDVPRLVHYLTKDISGPAPNGVTEMLNAMRRRGFDVNNNIGNTFLKQELREKERRAAQRRASRRTPPPPRGQPTPPATPQTPGPGAAGTPESASRRAHLEAARERLARMQTTRSRLSGRFGGDYPTSPLSSRTTRRRSLPGIPGTSSATSGATGTSTTTRPPPTRPTRTSPIYTRQEARRQQRPPPYFPAPKSKKHTRK